MIRRIRAGSPTTRIYIHTLLPVNNSFGDRGHFNKDEHLAAVNEGIKQMGTAEKISIIDLHPQFLDADKKLDKRFTYDGLHLNAEGYKKWAAILKPYIVK